LGIGAVVPPHVGMLPANTPDNWLRRDKQVLFILKKMILKDFDFIFPSSKKHQFHLPLDYTGAI
jgi:hypothetical protein